MARGKYQQWLEAGNLERVMNWAASGLTLAEIAANMGIHRATLDAWMKSYPDIHDAIKNGRALSCTAIENALFRRAAGACVTEETVDEFRGVMKDGQPYNGTVVRRTVTKQIPPDTTAMIFYLKNHMPEKYSDRQTTEITALPTIVLGVAPRRAAD